MYTTDSLILRKSFSEVSTYLSTGVVHNKLNNTLTVKDANIWLHILHRYNNFISDDRYESTDLKGWMQVFGAITYFKNILRSIYLASDEVQTQFSIENTNECFRNLIIALENANFVDRNNLRIIGA